MLEDLDLARITDASTRELVQKLLNLLEDVRAELRTVQADNQRLRDEINRLKGEQGTPSIAGNTPPPSPLDHSSERERHESKPWSKSRKIDRMVIDRNEVLEVSPERLPPDAVFKGYEAVGMQDVLIRTDNVRFHKAKFYSPSQPQPFLASLPSGYHGQFGRADLQPPHQRPRGFPCRARPPLPGRVGQ
jgi:hypothetical protein